MSTMAVEFELPAVRARGSLVDLARLRGVVRSGRRQIELLAGRGGERHDGVRAGDREVLRIVRGGLGQGLERLQHLRIVDAVQPVTVVHHDQQTALVRELQLLAEKGRVLSRLAVVLRDDAEVGGAGDDGNADRVAGAVGRGGRDVELLLGIDRRLRRVRQEVRLEHEDVGCRIAVRLRGRRQNQQQGEREQQTTHRRSISARTAQTWSILERWPPAGLPRGSSLPFSARAARSARTPSATGWSRPGRPRAPGTRGSTSCPRSSWPASSHCSHRWPSRRARSSGTARPARCPAWLFLVLPASAFLVQEHVERAAATAQLPVDTLAQPAVLAGLALQLPFGIAALLAARLLTRATAAVARRIGRRTRRHPARADQRHDRTDPCPRRVELLQPSGRGPPAFAVL